MGYEFALRMPVNNDHRSYRKAAGAPLGPPEQAMSLSSEYGYLTTTGHTGSLLESVGRQVEGAVSDRPEPDLDWPDPGLDQPRPAWP